MSLVSLYDEASLWMTPSGAKDGKLFSELPTDGSGDFTFSRGSNLAATRVGADGLIEKGRENLIKHSNTFNVSSWGNFNGASGQLGYDGSNDAWRYDSSSSVLRLQQLQGYQYDFIRTYSIYAKYVDTQWISLQIAGATNETAWFDVQNGVLGNLLNGFDSSITSVGNGWYRCTISGATANQDRVRLYVIGNNGSGTTIDGSVLIQDAQLEIGLAATDYIETGATTAQAGVLENEPRLDYSGGASCPSLLLEPQRTNIFEQSEYFSGTYWGKTGTGGGNAPVVTQNYAVSPEGLQNASRVQFDTNGSTSAHRSGLVRDFAFTTGDKYAISCWVKATSGNSEIFTFRIAGEQVGGEKTATNEWQLFTETHTATVTTTDDFGMQIRGNYSSQTSDILIYGMQLESAVSYPTSYIPTYGTSQTRSRDLVNNQSLNPVLGNGNISVMYDFVYDVVGREGSGQIFILYSGNNSLGIKGTQPTDRRMQLFSYGDFSGTIGFNEDVPYQTRHKVVFRVTGEVVELFYNGVKQNNTIDASALGGVYNWSRIKLDPTNAILAGLNQLAVFPTALTDSECIALTKLD